MKLSDKANYYSLASNQDGSDKGWSVFYHDVDVLDRFVFQIHGTVGGGGNNPIADVVGDTCTLPIPTSTWIFIAVRHDSIRRIAHLFCNNNSPDSAGAHNTIEGDAAFTYPGTPVTSSGDFTLGGNPLGPSPNGYINGDIDESGMWSRWLSNDEILELYNSGAGLSYPF